MRNYSLFYYSYSMRKYHCYWYENILSNIFFFSHKMFFFFCCYQCDNFFCQTFCFSLRSFFLACNKDKILAPYRGHQLVTVNQSELFLPSLQVWYQDHKGIKTGYIYLKLLIPKKKTKKKNTN